MVDITGVNSQLISQTGLKIVRYQKFCLQKQRIIDIRFGWRPGEISAGAKEAHTVGRLVQSARSQPEVRAEAVARAKEKLENGEYEGVVVSRETAKKILGLT